MCIRDRADPKISGGFTTSLRYKNLTLNANFAYSLGSVKRLNFLYSGALTMPAPQDNLHKDLLKRWKKPGDVTDIPRYGVTPQMDSRFLEDASFLRLKNLMLSYNFPQALLKKTNFLTHLRVFVQGQNLLTFTKFSGLDPEGVSNMYQAQYPSTRQFTFGLEVSF